MNIESIFPELNNPQFTALLLKHSLKKEFPPNSTLMEPGQELTHIPLVLEGSIKVFRLDENQNELFLYHLHEGEACAVSLNCCMVQKQSSIKAKTETQTTLLMIPIRFLDTWILEFPCWKEFIMSTYQRRFDDLLQTIDSIAFKKMDERLYQFLMDKSIALNSNTLNLTHQEIADEIHSTREVISRLMKQLEKRGMIRLGRNRIEIV